jgi:crotonobetainyl-CoA:carnitine CoA-transferase CaiB-like acyl-CoA transferase
VEIDFSKPEGADIVRRMATRSHILVENFRTGGLVKYGLDYASMAKVNAGLVYCSITGFGQNGPYAERPGYDYMIQAMGGLMSLTGEPDGEPMKAAVAVADLFTGMYATTGMLAALRHAERTGEGQHIDAALLDCQIAMLANLGLNYLTTGESPARMGNAHASIAPYQVFATADGHVVLAVGNDSQFRALCKHAGLDLADGARFATNAARVENRAALTEAIAPVMAARPSAYWVETLDDVGVPCGPINKLDEVFADAHVAARGAAHVMTRADGGDVHLIASPLKLSRTPASARRAPPLLGQDSDAVLSECAGATLAEIAAWRASGVIGPARHYGDGS